MCKAAGVTGSSAQASWEPAMKNHVGRSDVASGRNVERWRKRFWAGSPLEAAGALESAVQQAPGDDPMERIVRAKEAMVRQIKDRFGGDSSLINQVEALTISSEEAVAILADPASAEKKPTADHFAALEAIVAAPIVHQKLDLAVLRVTPSKLAGDACRRHLAVGGTTSEQLDFAKCSWPSAIRPSLKALSRRRCNRNSKESWRAYSKGTVERSDWRPGFPRACLTKVWHHIGRCCTTPQRSTETRAPRWSC